MGWMLKSGVSNVAASSTDECHHCRSDIASVWVGHAQGADRVSGREEESGEGLDNAPGRAEDSKERRVGERKANEE